jgi:hypothetical protein
MARAPRWSRRLHSHQQCRNFRAVRCLDRRCVHFDLPSISRFIPTELFVGLEIYNRLALGLLKGEIDYTLDEQVAAPRAGELLPNRENRIASPHYS